MKRGKVQFCHGKESGPWGVKIQRLARVAEAQGYEVESLDYSGINNPDERVAKLLKAQKPEENLILVGSSMGAYVATVASKTLAPEGLFLMAPAVEVSGYRSPDLLPTAKHRAIVHGWRDELIPPENSFRFAAKHQIALHLIDGDHRLNDQIDLIEKLFNLFLTTIAESS
ncbi:MAG: alpha/beta hydrolase [Acidobacteriota bacterium]